MSLKRKSKKDQKLEFLETTIANNVVAIKEGKKKIFSIHDLKSIRPLTEPQRMMMEGWAMGNNILAEGAAGSGKSYIALWLALDSIFADHAKQNKIIIVRSSVSSRASGFLPGSAEEKMEPYEAPYKDIVGHLLGKDSSYDEMKKLGKIEFLSTSYLRGMTWDNAIIIVDEIQSANFHELSSVVTRCGKNSRIILCGDRAQNDLIYNKYDQSGLPILLKIIERMPEFDIVHFTKHDIVRSGLVKSFLCAYEDEMDALIR